MTDFDFSTLVGETVKDRQGRDVRILAYFPGAVRSQQLATLLDNNVIILRYVNGTCLSVSQKMHSDLIPPKKTVRVKLWQWADSGTTFPVGEREWGNYTHSSTRGLQGTWVSEVTEIEINPPK